MRYTQDGFQKHNHFVSRGKYVESHAIVFGTFHDSCGYLVDSILGDLLLIQLKVIRLQGKLVRERNKILKELSFLRKARTERSV
jgi:hypothetical protein